MRIILLATTTLVMLVASPQPGSAAEPSRGPVRNQPSASHSKPVPATGRSAARKLSEPAGGLTAADLELIEFDWSVSLTSGIVPNTYSPILTEMTVTGHVENKSPDSTLENVKAGVFFSLDDAWSPSDFRLGDIVLDPLPPGVSTGFSGAVTPPLGVPVETFYGQRARLLLCVDDALAVQDPDRSNNVLSRVTEIVDPKAPAVVLTPEANPEWFFRTQAEALSFIRSQGFKPTAALLAMADPGFNRPAVARSSFHNGLVLPEGAFRIQLRPLTQKSGLWGPDSIQGADDSFNPFQLSPEVPEPSPPSTFELARGFFGVTRSLDASWGSYLVKYYKVCF